MTAIPARGRRTYGWGCRRDRASDAMIVRASPVRGSQLTAYIVDSVAVTVPWPLRQWWGHVTAASRTTPRPACAG